MTEKTYNQLKRLIAGDFDTKIFKDWSKFVDTYNFVAKANGLDEICLEDWETVRKLVRAKLLKEMPPRRLYFIDEHGCVTSYNPRF